MDRYQTHGATIPCKFQICISFPGDFMNSQMCKIGCVDNTHFCKSSHIFADTYIFTAFNHFSILHLYNSISTTGQRSPGGYTTTRFASHCHATGLWIKFITLCPSIHVHTKWIEFAKALNAEVLQNTGCV